jgi:hypothetical protein
MVVETPIPASSIRAATPEESEAWIDEWIKDIAIHFQEFAPNALAYAEALCLMGYTTKSSLNLFNDDNRRDALQELQVIPILQTHGALSKSSPSLLGCRGPWSDHGPMVGPWAGWSMVRTIDHTCTKKKKKKPNQTKS